MESKVISDICAKVLSCMREYGYSKDTLYAYSKVYERLAVYAQEKSIVEYSDDLGKQFMKDVYDFTPESKVNSLRPIDRALPAAIRKLSELRYLGYFLRKERREEASAWAMDDLTIIEEYRQSFSLIDLGERTRHTMLANLKQFYIFLEANSISSVKAIVSGTLQKYALSMQGDSKWYARSKVKELRRYLRYLHTHGHLSVDLSSALPRVRVVQRANIPNIWDEADITKLLQSIDRANPVGKRNYAIIVLVAGLGLRAGDVSDLMLSNLKWDKKEIEITQNKTGVINVCPMTDEIGWAIIDYLKHGRPNCDLPYVFLQHKMPYSKLGDTTAVQMLQNQMLRAGIKAKVPKTVSGMHSLRHSLAHRLLDENVPLELIADIMGHTEVVSSSPYLKVDINGLRECALSLEDVKKYVD